MGLRLSPTQHLEVRSASAEALEVEVVYEPGGGAPPAHFHPSQDEAFEVLEGALGVRVDGEERVHAAGARFQVPRGAVHAMWNAGEGRSRAVWRTTPALRTLEWFQAIDAVNRGEAADFPALLAEYAPEFRLAPPPQAASS